MLLSHLAFQDDCLLVYCAVVWQTHVLKCMHAITVSSKSRLHRFVINQIASV